MKPQSQVHWYNGLFLSPQHFQQADRHLNAVLQQLLRLKREDAWGLTDLVIDITALGQGILKLERCQGVMPRPHCTLIDLPATDPLPDAVEIDLPEGEHLADVYLTLPIAHENQRYGKKEESISDDYEIGYSQTVGLVRKQFALSIGKASRQGLESIKIGELERGVQKTFRWRLQRFIPTCLAVEASPVLLDICRRLVTDIELKARAAQHTGRRAVSEESLHLLMLNQQLPVLKQLLFRLPDATHPSELFAELLRLGGALSTFDSGLAKLPSYTHEDLTSCFHQLVTEVERLVKRPFTDEHDYVELSPWESRANVWEGNLSALGLRADGTYILAFVGGGIDSNKFAQELPRYSKITHSGRHALRLGASHILGVALEHQAAPPAPIEAKSNGVYFRLLSSGSDWAKICEEQKIGVWIDNEFVKGDRRPTVLVYTVRRPARP